uniref:Uncharacterized protein n=1 Tax=Lotus japonicus TaxID=34305 RepID=I3T003_LOTJA|nr:unknown [Lotus japonicus]
MEFNKLAGIIQMQIGPLTKHKTSHKQPEEQQSLSHFTKHKIPSQKSKQNMIIIHYKSRITGPAQLDQEEVIASTYQPSQCQTHTGCTDTWSNGP